MALNQRKDGEQVRVAGRTDTRGGPYLFGLILGAGLVLHTGLAANEMPPRERLDVQEAMRLALEQNKDLAQSAFSVERSELDLTGAKGGFAVRSRPDSHVRMSADEDTWEQGVRLAKRIPLGTDVSVGGRLTSTERSLGEDARRITLDVTVEQPLFRNFGFLMNREGIVHANQALKAAQRAYYGQMADLVVQVVEGFETLLQLEGQIEIADAAFQRLDRLYTVTSTREKQGRATRVDTLRVGLQRGRARSRLSASRERLHFEQQDFAELLGLPPGHTFELEPPPILEVDVPSVEDAVHQALDHRLDYAQVLQDHEDSVRGVKIARKGLYPDLSLVGTYQVFGEGDSFGDASSLDQDNWFVGLTAGTEFNRVQQRTTVGQARLDERSFAQAISIKRMSVAREVQQQLSAYRRAGEELKMVKGNLELAERRAVLARRLFELGRGDNFSVTDAEEAYLEAQNAVLSARAMASVSGYRLLHTLGALVDAPDVLRPSASASAAFVDAGASDGTASSVGRPHLAPPPPLVRDDAAKAVPR